MKKKVLGLCWGVWILLIPILRGWIEEKKQDERIKYWMSPGILLTSLCSR
jgi:hypothetical protein